MIYCSQCDLLVLAVFLAELNMIMETFLFKDFMAVLASEGFWAVALCFCL